MIGSFLRYELTLALRQKWVAAGTVLFAILAGGIAVTGLSADEATGVQGFGRTTASLLNLVLLLVPLWGLLLGSTQLARERDNWERLLAQPVAAGTMVWGRLLGLGVALTAALGIGFGLAGWLIGSRIGWDHTGAYWGLALHALALGWACLALGGLLAAAWPGRGPALLGAVGCWFVLTLLYDLAILGVTAATHGAALRGGLLLLLAANPVDLTRVACLLGLGAQGALGPTGAMLLRATEWWAPYALWGALLLWILIPAALAAAAAKHWEE